MKASEFIGLTKDSAQDLAEKNYMIYRLISVDGSPYFSYPEDKREDRICVEIEKGKIVKATVQ
jgi:hypothetical protein